MKIIISIRPEWVAKILNEDKKIEVRKGLALYNVLKKAEERGEEVEFLMYVTKGKPHLFAPNGYNEHWWTQRLYNGKTPYNGAVVARFKADFDVLEHFFFSTGLERYRCFGNSVSNANFGKELEGTCLHFDELDEYLEGVDSTALLIRDLEIFDKPKDLADYGLKRAPQSWAYAK